MFIPNDITHEDLEVGDFAVYNDEFVSDEAVKVVKKENGKIWFRNVNNIIWIEQYNDIPYCIVKKIER